MIKIGGVSIDVSHPKAFSVILERDKFDMRYTHICKKSFRTDEEVQWFSNRFGAEVVSEIEDMSDKVDIGFIQACNWDKHLEFAKPFLDKEKPVFIDKPLVGSVKDIAKVRELVKNGAKIYGSSTVRHADEIREFLSKPFEERGDVLYINGVCGSNEYDYAIHIVEAMSRIVGAKAVNNRFVGEGKNKDGVKSQTFAITYENGAIGTYTTYLGGWIPFSMTVVTTKGTFNFGPNTRFYENGLEEIYNMMTGKPNNLADMEDILNCCEIMICGKKSRDTLSGAVVNISDLEENDGFDGYAFEKEYEGIANRKVYAG